MVIKYCNNTCKASKVGQHRHGKNKQGNLGARAREFQLIKNDQACILRDMEQRKPKKNLQRVKKIR